MERKWKPSLSSDNGIKKKSRPEIHGMGQGGSFFLFVSSDLLIYSDFPRSQQRDQTHDRTAYKGDSIVD